MDLIEAFQGLKDTRIERHKQHSLHPNPPIERRRWLKTPPMLFLV